MTETETLMLYSRVARPIMLPWTKRRSCVAATRLTQLVLGAFGFLVTPVAVKLQVQCDKRKCVYVSGIEEEERQAAIARAEKAGAKWIDLPPEMGESGYRGHVIAFVDGRWLVDASIDQASQPSKGFVIPDEALVIDLGEGGAARLIDVGGLHGRFTLDDGTSFTIDYGPTGDTSFLQSDAWLDEGLPFLASEIHRSMSAAIV